MKIKRRNSNRKWNKTHGFRIRMRTRGGRKILKARRHKTKLK